MQLIEAEVFSDKICQLCNNDLNVFSQFRKDLTIKQKHLYRQLQENDPELASATFSSDIKPSTDELNEFIDCNPSDLLAENDEPPVVIKSEVEQIPDEFLRGAKSDEHDLWQTQFITIELA